MSVVGVLWMERGRWFAEPSVCQFLGIRCTTQKRILPAVVQNLRILQARTVLEYKCSSFTRNANTETCSRASMKRILMKCHTSAPAASYGDVVDDSYIKMKGSLQEQH
jgi:hypothetical protein